MNYSKELKLKRGDVCDLLCTDTIIINKHNAVIIKYGDSIHDAQELRPRFVDLKDLDKQDDGNLAMELAATVDDIASDSYTDVKIRSRTDVQGFLRGEYGICTS